jgi:putative ABC transport system ATP-binding protein
MSEPENSQMLVRVQGFTRVYHSAGQKVQALRGVDLDQPRGMLAALNGRSGSAKTTLLNLIGGLDRLIGGRIEFDGRPLADLTGKGLALLRRHHSGLRFSCRPMIP